MATAKQYTDPYMAAYRRVPPVGDRVCSVCHTGTPTGDTVCNSCLVTMGQVTHPVRSVLPISLYEVPDQYWNILRYYKDDPRPEVRSQLGTVLAATLARFGAAHWDCIVGMMRGDPTIVTTVPSSGRRTGEHPLTRAVRRSARLRALYDEVLTKGPGTIGHRRAADDGFIAVRPLKGERVLLIEDTFTTGGRTQSAASALWLAGASSIGVVSAGRVIDPDWNENCQRVWAYARRTPFTFDVCALCTPPEPI